MSDAALSTIDLRNSALKNSNRLGRVLAAIHGSEVVDWEKAALVRYERYMWHCVAEKSSALVKQIINIDRANFVIAQSIGLAEAAEHGMSAL